MASGRWWAIPVASFVFLNLLLKAFLESGVLRLRSAGCGQQDSGHDEGRKRASVNMLHPPELAGHAKRAARSRASVVIGELEERSCAPARRLELR